MLFGVNTGMKGVRFNENQRQPVQNANQQNRSPQANVVLVEEQDTPAVSGKQQYNGREFRVLHVDSDCSQCKQNDVVLEQPVTVLAVTRSGKHYQQDRGTEDRVMKDPRVWEEQKKVRMGCLKEIQKQQKDVIPIQGIVPPPGPSQKEQSVIKRDHEAQRENAANKDNDQSGSDFESGTRI